MQKSEGHTTVADILDRTLEEERVEQQRDAEQDAIDRYFNAIDLAMEDEDSVRAIVTRLSGQRA